MALYDYVSNNDRELSIQEGDIMSILELPVLNDLDSLTHNVADDIPFCKVRCQ